MQQSPLLPLHVLHMQNQSLGCLPNTPKSVSGKRKGRMSGTHWTVNMVSRLPYDLFLSFTQNPPLLTPSLGVGMQGKWFCLFLFPTPTAQVSLRIPHSKRTASGTIWIGAHKDKKGFPGWAADGEEKLGKEEMWPEGVWTENKMEGYSSIHVVIMVCLVHGHSHPSSTATISILSLHIWSCSLKTRIPPSVSFWWSCVSHTDETTHL